MGLLCFITLHSLICLKCCLMFASPKATILLVLLLNLFVSRLGLNNKHFLAVVYVRCLLLQRSAMFQCHLPTGTARYRSMSTSVNYSPEINFTNSFFVSNYSIGIGFVFSMVYSYLLSLPHQNILPSQFEGCYVSLHFIRFT